MRFFIYFYAPKMGLIQYIFLYVNRLHYFNFVVESNILGNINPYDPFHYKFHISDLVDKTLLYFEQPIFTLLQNVWPYDLLYYKVYTLSISLSSYRFLLMGKCCTWQILHIWLELLQIRQDSIIIACFWPTFISWHILLIFCFLLQKALLQ